jgi:hypothetical protein
VKNEKLCSRMMGASRTMLAFPLGVAATGVSQFATARPIATKPRRGARIILHFATRCCPTEPFSEDTEQDVFLSKPCTTATKPYSRSPSNDLGSELVCTFHCCLNAFWTKFLVATKTQMKATRDEEAGRYGPREDDLHSDDSVAEELRLRIEEFDIEDDAPTSSRFTQRQHLPTFFQGFLYVQHFIKSIVIWAKGPRPPQIQAISPWFPSVQEAPLRLLDRCLPTSKGRITLFFAFYIGWISLFAVLLLQSTYASEIEGFGMPVPIRCEDTIWLSSNYCGLDGIDCRPFNGSNFAFRCPANCASVRVLNPRAVGAQEIVYRPLVIGGPIYRGDSFICGAAIHVGAVNNADGGCGIISRIGQQRNYTSTLQNGITSIEFDSHFPLSFSFLPSTCKAKDLRWPLLFVSVAFTVLLSLFTTSPSLTFASTFTGIFAHVGLVSDPPTILGLDELFSNILGKFLPAAFCSFVVLRYCVKLEGLTAQIEKSILWLGGCWVGALSNYTLDWIPIVRLTAHDLEQQPGAKLALAIVVTILGCIAGQQVYYFRLEGRLPRYLALYSAFVTAILLLVAVPGFNLRIHHYVLSLLLLPGTSMQTRPALLYQGILIGLFINGIARWGFDPILQTDRALQGDGQYNSLLPTILDPTILLGATSSITFKWAFPATPRQFRQFDGISVLVNDVERFRSYTDEGSESEKNFTWFRNIREPEYFRFGYMKGGQSFDYTKAGIWDSSGSWITMEPGPSLKR